MTSNMVKQRNVHEPHMMYRPTATWTLFVLYTVHIPASYRFTVRICAGLGPIATFRLCFLFFLYLTCKLIRFVWTVFERLLLLKAEFSRSDDTRWPLLKISCSLEILKLSWALFVSVSPFFFFVNSSRWTFFRGTKPRVTLNKRRTCIRKQISMYLYSNRSCATTNHSP